MSHSGHGRAPDYNQQHQIYRGRRYSLEDDLIVEDTELPAHSFGSQISSRDIGPNEDRPPQLFSGSNSLHSHDLQSDRAHPDHQAGIDLQNNQHSLNCNPVQQSSNADIVYSFDERKSRNSLPVTADQYIYGTGHFISANSFQEPLDETPSFNHFSRPMNTSNFLSESVRLKTFSGIWPPSAHVNIYDLARNGFYYLGPEDRVRCAFCQGVLKRWASGDTVEGEHSKHFPHCSVVRRVPNGNIPIRGPAFSQSTSISSPKSNTGMSHSDSQGKLSHEKNKALGNSVSNENLGILENKPKNPRYALESNRLATFRNWSKQIHQTPEDLANAGLYYLGTGDRVKCFSCDGLLSHWEPEDVPWIEHARWFPECHFVRLIKGDHFVQQVQRGEKVDPALASNAGGTFVAGQENQQQSASVQALVDNGYSLELISEAIKQLHLDDATKSQEIPRADAILSKIMDMEEDMITQNGSSINIQPAAKIGFTSGDSLASNDSEISHILEENRALKEQKICKVCLEHEISVIFLPCGHLVCCAACASSLSECPICRGSIKGTAKAFWA